MCIVRMLLFAQHDTRIFWIGLSFEALVGDLRRFSRPLRGHRAPDCGWDEGIFQSMLAGPRDGFVVMGIAGRLYTRVDEAI